MTSTALGRTRMRPPASTLLAAVGLLVLVLSVVHLGQGSADVRLADVVAWVAEIGRAHV